MLRCYLSLFHFWLLAKKRTGFVSSIYFIIPPFFEELIFYENSIINLRPSGGATKALTSQISNFGKYLDIFK